MKGSIREGAAGTQKEYTRNIKIYKEYEGIQTGYKSNLFILDRKDMRGDTRNIRRIYVNIKRILGRYALNIKGLYL